MSHDLRNQPDEYWQKRLTQDQFYVCRKKWTEPPFTGQYVDTKTPGIYECVCCETPLFKSETKYDSGSGWPAFFDVISKADLEFIQDLSCGMDRTEILCRKCGSHLGHVFEDGPKPTGLRYCVNSNSLRLKAK